MPPSIAHLEAERATLDAAGQEYFGRDLEAMSDAVNYHDWIVRRFTPYLGKRVLEVGAGAGTITSGLLAAGVESVHALEPAANMYALLGVRFKDEAKVSTEQAFFSDVAARFQGHFDAAVYINVLEHVEHDEEELRAVWSALKPGGRVCIYVPALPALYSKFDARIGHYRRYTKGGLRELLERTGFKPVELRYCDLAGIIPWYLSCVLLRQNLRGSQIAIYDRCIFPLTNALEEMVPPPIGKNLLAVAEKSSA